ncbi:MAG: peptidase S10 [Acidobacteriaceae bacterium]
MSKLNRNRFRAPNHKSTLAGSILAGLLVPLAMACPHLSAATLSLRGASAYPLLSGAIQQSDSGGLNASNAKPTGVSAANLPKEESSTTEHTFLFRGQKIPYRATASTLLLKNDKGEPIGLMYSVAYTRSDVSDPSRRPVAFLYNGGPGSASMWLHLGAFGPKRVQLNGTNAIPPAPYKLVDNEDSLLDKTDLVFIDAMGTGYSRAIGKGHNADFYGTDGDALAFAQFIHTYLSRYNRWNSPKFLIGESYGTFRSAAVADYLKSKYSTDLNGIVLISSVLNLSTITFSPANISPCIFYLPSYAAVAWYHKTLKQQPSDLTAFVDEARNYAKGEYAAALFQGAQLPAAEKETVAKKLTYFTGIDEDYWLKANLCTSDGKFDAEVLRAEGKSVASLDARFAGYDYDRLTERSQTDPLEDGIESAFTSLLNQYNHNELKFGMDENYNNSRIDGHGWNWKRASSHGFPSAPQTVSDLALTMISNPHLLVQVENGYFDLATPFFATEFTMNHLGIPPELQKNINLDYYKSGHMIYLQDEAHRQLHDNIARFIDRATEQ